MWSKSSLIFLSQEVETSSKTVKSPSCTWSMEVMDWRVGIVSDGVCQRSFFLWEKERALLPRA